MATWSLLKKEPAKMNNFPINEDAAFDALRELIAEVEEKDPDGLEAFRHKMKVLMDIPKKTHRLMNDLSAAVPFEVGIPKHVRQSDPTLFRTPHEHVCGVKFLEDYGGIAVELAPTDEIDNERVISITMIEMLLKHPLRKRVNEYRKKRLKYLKKHPY